MEAAATCCSSFCLCRQHGTCRDMPVANRGDIRGHPGTHHPISVIRAIDHRWQFLGLCPCRVWHSLDSEDAWACMLGGWVTSDWGLPLSVWVSRCLLQHSRE